MDIVTLRGHSDRITSAAFSPDGRRIVTGSYDQTAKVWEVSTGMELVALKGHSAQITSVDFSPDGQRIVTGSFDGTARIWEASSGMELVTLEGMVAPGEQADVITSVAFSPDGQRIFGLSGRTIKVWVAASPREVEDWQEEEQGAEKTKAAALREIGKELEQFFERVRLEKGGIKQWLLLAPIPFTAGQGNSSELDAEQLAGENVLNPRPEEQVEVRGQTLQWHVRQAPDNLCDFTPREGTTSENSLIYAVCYITSERDQHSLQMFVRSGEQSKVYLNGQQVYRCAVPRTSAAELFDEDQVSGVHLRQGTNTVVFKVVSESRLLGGSIRFTDAAGNPVPGLKVNLTPE